MKHLTTILAAGLCAVCLSGCSVEERRLGQFDTDSNPASQITEFTHKGHSYLLYQRYSGRAYGVAGITHDPDCPCQHDRYAKNTHDNPDTPVAMETQHASQTKTPRHMLADTAFLNQFHQASERAAAEATASTAEARRRAMGFSPKPTEGGEE